MFQHAYACCFGGKGVVCWIGESETDAATYDGAKRRKSYRPLNALCDYFMLFLQ